MQSAAEQMLARRSDADRVRENIFSGVLREARAIAGDRFLDGDSRQRAGGTSTTQCASVAR
jgi:hypothetical protein